MKVNLHIMNDGGSLYDGSYDVSDADSFGQACADAWCRLREQQLAKESSIGALMEHLDGGVLDLLTGAHITLDKA
jgi:hypothetical protein